MSTDTRLERVTISLPGGEVDWRSTIKAAPFAAVLRPLGLAREARRHNAHGSLRHHYRHACRWLWALTGHRWPKDLTGLGPAEVTLRDLGEGRFQIQKVS